MHIISAESTEKFIGPTDAPLQLVRVEYRDAAAATRVRIDGDGLSGSATAEPDTGSAGGWVEVPVQVHDPVPGQQRAAWVNGTAFTFTVAEPGWTMFLVGHFHYDPVWWNTQANYTSVWTENPLGACRQTNGFALVRRHLDWARDHPEYKFVLAEVDYLKPYWDTVPQDREELRNLLACGRLEVMGGTYNEPSTNLTDAETTIRNLVAGIGFQRDVMGADPATAWQLDVFGHDPQFPGLVADAGLSSSAWARGPFHQWGPMADHGDPRRMQFASEFEWIAPSGRGLVTHYMPAHYAGGWWMDACETLAEAEAEVYRLFTEMKKVAATRNVLLPVGTDFTPPNRWITEIHRDWNARYTWPKFVCAVPREFFAAVRAEVSGAALSPQTRDMNPIYTGCHVSYIDTKQANRAGERAVLAAESFGVFAAALTGANYPQAALTKAWTQLCYGAHHDAVTGSEADQVYLDLLTSWRDAWQLGTDARDAALTVLSGLVGTGAQDEHQVVVWNPVAAQRSDVVTLRLDSPLPGGVRVLDIDGSELPVHVEHGGQSIRWLARDVPSLGWRSYRLIPADQSAGWQPVAGAQIANERHQLTADAQRGGGITSWRYDGREMIIDGAVGNQLAVYDEYPRHPQSGEGPWHLVPSGNLFTSAVATAVRVQAYRGPLGERLVVSGRIKNVLAYTQTLTLWHGVDRVDCTTAVEEFTGADHLLRLRWPCPVPGAMPVAEVADAVIGRGFALLHDPSGRSVDTTQHPWTLDTSANRWFGLSATARVSVGDASRAVSVAEIITAATVDQVAVRDLVVALARSGVTATCSQADGPRCGDVAVDSNLPDVRISLGGPERNSFTKAVLDAADPAYAEEVARQLARHGRARVWVPAARPLDEVWIPGADLSGLRALPVLVLAAANEADPGDALAAEIVRVAEDLADHEITVDQQVPAQMTPFEARTVALVNRGVPSFAVDTAGTLHTALLRSCTSWPSAAWNDDPRRTAPDGSAFQLMHWTHSFDYALMAGDGDWRQADITARSAQFADPLRAVVVTGGDGPLPASGSLLRVSTGEGSQGPATVSVGALKAAGNPLARGSAEPVDACTLTVRLVENHGEDAVVALHSDLGPLQVLGRADLVEQPQQHPDPQRLHGYEIATLTARLELPGVGDTPPSVAVLAPEAEAAQPIYARYWLHNRGPAPLGGMPATPTLHPHRLDAAPGAQLDFELRVASDSVDAELSGAVRLRMPPGWAVSPALHPVHLDAGGYSAAALTVMVPADTVAGLYPIRAQLDLTGDLPPSWRQTVEDVAVVRVGDPGEDRLLYLDEPTEVAVIAGQAAALSVSVGTDAHADVAVEAHLISPWGTWEWAGPAALGAVVPARGRVQLSFQVAPPRWAQPGTWWALVRVAGGGALEYTPAVRLAVLAPDSAGQL